MAESESGETNFRKRINYWTKIYLTGKAADLLKKLKTCKMKTTITTWINDGEMRKMLKSLENDMNILFKDKYMDASTTELEEEVQAIKDKFDGYEAWAFCTSGIYDWISQYNHCVVLFNSLQSMTV